MSIERACCPNWRDPAAYAPLVEADRSLFAWEWLRRNVDYRLAAEQALSASYGDIPPSVASGHFGLVAFEPPHLAVPEARPFWRSDAYPYVLSAGIGATKQPGDLFDRDRMRGASRIILGDRCEHLLLSDGLRTIRVDGQPGTFTGGPVSLRYHIEGVASAEPALLTLHCFLAFCRASGFSRSLHRREARARRWILILRASDALTAGADQREIAGELLSRSVGEPDWRSRESSVRSQAQRLVRAARYFGNGGYRSFLD
ncbi:MAG: DUF2285 domain-containing protein [Pseudomonadota bacterium]